MSDYQQNYSGFPIDPVPQAAPPGGERDSERTAYLPPTPSAAQPYPSAPAEETALLPPVPGYPSPSLNPQLQPNGDPDPSTTTQSRFGHIEAKYGNPAMPQPDPAGTPTAPAPAPQEQPSAWPAGWERPAAPPAGWAPGPAGGASQPASGEFAAQQFFGSGEGLAPGQPVGPAAYGHGPQGPQAGAYPGGPGQAPPQPGQVTPDGLAPGQALFGGGSAGEGSFRDAFASTHSVGVGVGVHAGAGPAEQPLGVGGGSLREAFATAEPTGPGRGAPEGVHVGAVLAPGQSPLEFGGGSLREAFAEAQPTGPVTGPAPFTVGAPRVRSGSPIIDPAIQPGAITLGLGALVGVAALAGKFGLVVPVALLQAVTAAGWFRLNGMWPARQGIALAALGGFVADAAILAASAHSSGPAILAGTLGAFFMLVLILQIFRPSNPDERFYALTVCASATVVTVLAGGFLAVGSGRAVLAGALAAGVSAAVSAALRTPPVVGFAAGGFLGLLVGGGLAAATGLGLTQGLLLGLGAGVCALIGRRVAAYDFPSRFVHMTAGVSLPLALAAPMVYLIAR